MYQKCVKLIIANMLSVYFNFFSIKLFALVGERGGLWAFSLYIFSIITITTPAMILNFHSQLISMIKLHSTNSMHHNLNLVIHPVYK